MSKSPLVQILICNLPNSPYQQWWKCSHLFIFRLFHCFQSLLMEQHVSRWTKTQSLLWLRHLPGLQWPERPLPLPPHTHNNCGFHELFDYRDNVWKDVLMMRENKRETENGEVHWFLLCLENLTMNRRSSLKNCRTISHTSNHMISVIIKDEMFGNRHDYRRRRSFDADSRRHQTAWDRWNVINRIYCIFQLTRTEILISFSDYARNPVDSSFRPWQMNILICIWFIVMFFCRTVRGNGVCAHDYKQISDHCDDTSSKIFKADFVY